MAPMTGPRIRIGTSGWHYPGGAGAWDGVFYPPRGRHDRAEERYDYHYSAAELRPFRDTADAAARLVKRLYLYMNNHFAAKSAANAATLKHQLGLEVPGTWRGEMVARYPELDGVVRAGPATAPPLPIGGPAVRE